MPGRGDLIANPTCLGCTPRSTAVLNEDGAIAYPTTPHRVLNHPLAEPLRGFCKQGVRGSRLDGFPGHHLLMLAASTALDTQLPDVTVDAAVSRQPEVIFDRIRERKRLGRLGDVVVIGAGTNGRIRSADLTSILDLLQDRKRVVLVTCHADRSWIGQSNASIRSAGRRFATGNVVVVDWDTYASRHRRILYADGIHPRPGAGSRAYARLIRAAIGE
jgi:hypothetical protein